MSGSGQAFLRRNRPPRVKISYASPDNAEKQIELPFVMGVVADLSGNAPGAEKPDIADRKFLDVDMDNFGRRMSAIKPGLSFRVKSRLGNTDDETMKVDLQFNSMDDFRPGQVARAVPALAELMRQRDAIKNLLAYLDGKADAQKMLGELLKNPALMAAVQERSAAIADAKKSDAGNTDEQG